MQSSVGLREYGNLSQHGDIVVFTWPIQPPLGQFPLLLDVQGRELCDGRKIIIE